MPGGETIAALRGPVAIGGTGGSGTRVVAQVLRELGFHIGEDVNYALDNLWFTLLFRRPELYGRPPQELAAGIRLFEKAMRGSPAPNGEEVAFLEEAVADLRLQFAQRQNDDGESWTGARVESLRRAAGPGPEQLGWGWKQPCTHFFLGDLERELEGLRYIHVIRSGFELARKPLTRFQLHLWGHHFGVEPPADADRTAGACLRFWLRSNRQALAVGEELLGDRLLLLRYESVCADPRATVESIARFANVEVEPRRLDALAALVRPPAADRDTVADVADFEPEDVAAVEALGSPAGSTVR